MTVHCINTKISTYGTHTVYYSMIIAMYKYTCTLIHNYAFTQYTHMIFSEKINITNSVCVLHIKHLWHDTTCNVTLIIFKQKYCL